MTYTENLKEILKQTAKGFGVGALISVILNLILFKANNVGSFLTDAFAFTLLLGPICTIIFTAKSGTKVLTGKISNMFVSALARSFSFSAIGSGGVVFFIIQLFLAIILFVVLAIYMAAAYLINLIYYIIMAILEKKNTINENTSFTVVTDTIVNYLPLIVTVIASATIIPNMF